MKILYKQGSGESSLFYNFGIENLYLKEISEVSDSRLVTKKEHSHAGYEIHIVTEGEQIYETSGEKYSVRSGSFIIIPPRARHCVASSLPGSRKYSITFSVRKNSADPFFEQQTKVLFGKYDSEIAYILQKISEEYRYARVLSSLLVENSAFELTVKLFRLAGFEEERCDREPSDGNTRIEMAKKYINDNVEQDLSVSDVAAYCYLGEKQLTRLFRLYEKASPAEYIRSVRTHRIELLLSDKTLSIKEVSRIMNFNNEYYFNAFFKKYYGMPPGEYRKTLSQ